MAFSKQDSLLYVIDKAVTEYNYDRITRFQVAKIVFYLDLESIRKTSRKVSNFKFKKCNSGPYSKDIVNTLEKLVQKAFLAHTKNYYNYVFISSLRTSIKDKEKIKNRIKKINKKKLDFIFNVSKDEDVLLDKITNLPEVKKVEYGRVLL